MFKNGLEKPLLEWLKKEAGKDWTPPTLDEDLPQAITWLFGEDTDNNRFRLTHYMREVWVEDSSEQEHPYTRARFRAALRRLRK